MQYIHATQRLLLPLDVEVAMLKPAEGCGEYLSPLRSRVLIDWIASAPNFHLIDCSLLIPMSCIIIEAIPDMIFANLREIL